MSETHQKAVSFLQVPDVDAIVVPVGGGGLIAGIATVVRKIRNGTFCAIEFHTTKNDHFIKTGSGQT
jgi:threonine dehydratase